MLSTNVIILNSIQVDLVSRATLSHGIDGIVVTIATQMKNGLYHDWFPTNMFLPFVVEVFEWLHQSKWMNFFINVPTLHGKQKVVEAFLLQFCAHFTCKRC
jgi:hypothetical protein